MSGRDGAARQIGDLADEVEELHATLAAMPAAAWTAATGFKRWTPTDIVQHLHWGDLMAMASADGPAAFSALRGRMTALREQGLGNVAATRRLLGDLGGAALLETWHATARGLCGRLSDLAPETRMPWSGPGMGLRMFVRGFGFDQFAGLEIDIIMALRRTIDTIGPMQAGIEPLRRIGRAHLHRQHETVLVIESACVVLAGEIATLPTPIGPATGQSVEDLLGAHFRAVTRILRQFGKRLFIRHRAPQP